MNSNNERRVPKSLRTNFQSPGSSDANNIVAHPGREKERYGPLVLLADTGESAKRLRFLLTDGQVFSMPYAYLPVYHLTTEQDLVIKTSDVEILIRGRGLNLLEELLSMEQVVGLHEATTSIDDYQHDIFVSKIEIEGRLAP